MNAHFLLHEETKLSWGNGMPVASKKVGLRVQHDRAAAAGRLASASMPTGTIELHLSGEEAMDFFGLGRLYKVEFTPVEDPVTQERPKMAVLEHDKAEAEETEGEPAPLGEAA